MNRSNFHRTVAIEVKNVLVDNDGNINPYAEDVISNLLRIGYNVILWSEDLKYIHENFQVNKHKNLKVMKKTEKKSSEIYFVIDIDFDFGSKYKLWSMSPFFSITRTDGSSLKHLVADYITIVANIEARSNDKKKN